MKILFVCRHNANRSILAEAIAKQQLPASFEIASAGSEPRGEVNPRIINFLENMGLNSSELRSKSWEDRLTFHPDIVISVCDTMHNEVCPNWLADGIRVAWDLEYIPNNESTEAEFDSQCQKVVNSLRRRIQGLEKLNCPTMTRDEIMAELNLMHTM